jgi:hypothetical protein
MAISASSTDLLDKGATLVQEVSLPYFSEFRKCPRFMGVPQLFASSEHAGVTKVLAGLATLQCDDDIEIAHQTLFSVGETSLPSRPCISS